MGPTAHNANMAGRHLLIWTVHRDTPLYQASGRGYLHSRGYALGDYSLSNPGPVTHGQRGQPRAALR